MLRPTCVLCSLRSMCEQSSGDGDQSDTEKGRKMVSEIIDHRRIGKISLPSFIYSLSLYLFLEPFGRNF